MYLAAQRTSSERVPYSAINRSSGTQSDSKRSTKQCYHWSTCQTARVVPSRERAVVTGLSDRSAV